MLFGDVVRACILVEITFGVGFLTARFWKRRKHPAQYLSLMAAALIAYSLFAFFVVAYRWGHPLTWRTPFAGIAATIAFVAAVRNGYEREEAEIHN